MAGSVRTAAESDVDAIVGLAEIERAVQHANRASAVWRKAAGSAGVIRTNTVAGLGRAHMLLLVHEDGGSVDGFVSAHVSDSEPFFDPGGQVCGVGDFALRDPAAWRTVGGALLGEVTAEGRRRGAVAAVVLCADYDGGKRALLEGLGYGPAWGYRTRDLTPSDGAREPLAPGEVRPATAADADAVVRLVEADFAARDAHRSSAVWRKAEGSAAAYRKELADLLGQEGMLLRVHESAGAVDGYVRAMLVDGPPVWDPGGKVCFVTEFVLGDAAAWSTVGAALLGSATGEARGRGAVAALVQYGHHEAGKQVMLAGLEYGPAWSYRTRDL